VSESHAGASGPRVSPWAATRHVRRFIHRPRYEEEEAKQELELAFEEYQLDYGRAFQHLERVLKEAGLPSYDELDGMASQHWVFAAALSAAPPRRILEIGTFDGRFTRVLAALFPESDIVTCDLPEESPIFKDSYRRESDTARERFLDIRKRNLARHDNITFIQANSFLLPRLQHPGFDLVWVDGGHDYPDVAWDACNAWHLAADGGLILFDDLYLHPAAKRGSLIPDFNNSAALLRILESEELCHVTYFPKRINPQLAADPILRKHIGVVRKVLPHVFPVTV
jgi:predicted O-methyltransferase YrrM